MFNNQNINNIAVFGSILDAENWINSITRNEDFLFTPFVLSSHQKDQVGGTIGQSRVNEPCKKGCLSAPSMVTAQQNSVNHC